MIWRVFMIFYTLNSISFSPFVLQEFSAPFHNKLHCAAEASISNPMFVRAA